MESAALRPPYVEHPVHQGEQMVMPSAGARLHARGSVTREKVEGQQVSDALASSACLGGEPEVPPV